LVSHGKIRKFIGVSCWWNNHDVTVDTALFIVTMLYQAYVSMNFFEGSYSNI